MAIRGEAQRQFALGVGPQRQCFMKPALEHAPSRIAVGQLEGRGLGLDQTGPPAHQHVVVPAEIPRRIDCFRRPLKTLSHGRRPFLEA